MIDTFITKHNLPAYRSKQFNQAFFKQLITGYDQLTTWPKNLREDLAAELPFTSLEEVTRLTSAKGNTVKVLFKLTKGQLIESVLMRHLDGRNTVCVSCMVGCPVNCSFCATGKLGFGGNLTAKEIVDQVMYFQRLLQPEDKTVTNIVFMGMGEPLLNLDAVLPAISLLTSPETLGLSPRRLTVSTSGYLPQFDQLTQSGFRGRLAISLHAPNQELRASLMPVAKVYPLDKLMEKMDQYTKLTNKRISYEYILIAGVTDNVKQAGELVKLFGHRLAHLNLIPYNPIPGTDWQRPSRNRVMKFAQILRSAGIPCSVRVTFGDDINAACGQLAKNYSANPNHN